MRDENAANEPAYGSLEGLGAPRKLKKKPVLVLDPEELEKAHAMFHEASADLLGEDVERAPKPATILGLAPMEEDDPDEMGASDEADAIDDADLPSPEDVLSLTRRKTPAIAPDETLDAAAFDEGGYADPDGPINDDLDLENRIFPSLPVQPDPVEEAETPDPMPIEETPVVKAKPEPVVEIEQSEKPEAAHPVTPRTVPEPVAKSPIATTPATPNERAGSEQPGSSDRSEKPAQPETLMPVTKRAPEQDIEAPMPTIEALHQRLREQFNGQAEKTETDFEDDDFDLDAWLAEPQVDARSATSAPQPPEEIPGEKPGIAAGPKFEPVQQPTTEPLPEPRPTPLPLPVAKRDPEPEPEPIPEPEPAPFELAEEYIEEPSPAPAEAAQPSSQNETEHAENGAYTVTDDDDVVDGYAFLRDPRSRRDAISATRQGQQSALRAKLIREAREEAEQSGSDRAGSNSLILRFVDWIKNKFG